MARSIFRFNSATKKVIQNLRRKSPKGKPMSRSQIIAKAEHLLVLVEKRRSEEK